MNSPIADPTIFGLPLFLMFVITFVLNFFIARYFTIQLIKDGFIAKHNTLLIRKKNKVVRAVNTAETTLRFQKCIITWFFPVVGALCMFGLWFICVTVSFVIRTSQKLFLNHI